MRKTIIVIVGITQLSFSSIIGLQELLQNAQSSIRTEEMIEYNFNALESKTLANIQTAPLTFNHQISRSTSPIESGFEYEIGISKEFKLGNIKKLEQQVAKL
jgi:hypothetical protein